MRRRNEYAVRMNKGKIMDDKITQAARALYTVEETKQAAEWIEKARSLGEKYKNELDEAGDDTDKKNEIIKLIYDEIGPVPFPVQMSMAAGIPIVVEISRYQKETENSKKVSVINPDGSWTCWICKSNNTGNYCRTCGNLGPNLTDN